jgi:hypothetical protein
MSHDVAGLLGFSHNVSFSLVRKFAVEIAGVALIVFGIFGELGIGLKIASINSQMRGKSAELSSKDADLRSKSDQLVALLEKETEDEHSARVEAEESVAWRRLTADDRRKIRSELAPFAIRRTWVQYNSNDVEAFNFGHDLATSVPGSWNPTEPMPVLSLREGPVPVGRYGPLERGIRITVVDKSYEKAADLLIRLLSSFGFDCQKSDAALAKNLQYAPMIVVSVDSRPEGLQGEAKVRADVRRTQAKSAQLETSEFFRWVVRETAPQLLF